MSCAAVCRPRLYGAAALVDHLTRCRGVGAVIATHHPAENADPIVADMGARGWVLAGVEYVAGKRVRYLVPPASKRKAGK